MINRYAIIVWFGINSLLLISLLFYFVYSPYCIISRMQCLHLQINKSKHRMFGQDKMSNTHEWSSTFKFSLKTSSIFTLELHHVYTGAHVCYIYFTFILLTGKLSSDSRLKIIVMLLESDSQLAVLTPLGTSEYNQS